MEKQINLNNRWNLKIKEENGELKVFVHRIENGQEVVPNGYVLGHNALILPKR